MAILQIIPFYKQFYISFYELIYKKLHTFYVNWIVHKLEVEIHITVFLRRGCNSEMAPLCSCHALMAGIWTSKLTKIVNEIWLTEIESFNIFKDVGNEQWWLNTMSQVSISTVYSPPPSTLTLFYNPSAFKTHTFFWINFVVSINNNYFFIFFLRNCFHSLALHFLHFSVSNPHLG